MKILVSLICPIRDEEKNIPYVFRTLKKVLGETEVLFVEGGSKDNSWELAKKLDNKKNIHGVVFKAIKQKGKGKSGAVSTGFDEAWGKYLMIVDADLSLSQKEVHKIIQLFITQGDNIIASGNRLKGLPKPKAFYWINYLGNYFFRYYYSILLRTYVKDISCGSKGMTKKTWLKVRVLRKKTKQLDSWGDIDWLYYGKKSGARICFVDVSYKKRYGESKLQDADTRFKFALNMFTIGFDIIYFQLKKLFSSFP